jgi:hypothetical protein
MDILNYIKELHDGRWLVIVIILVILALMKWGKSFISNIFKYTADIIKRLSLFIIRGSFTTHSPGSTKSSKITSLIKYIFFFIFVIYISVSLYDLLYKHKDIIDGDEDDKS